MKLGLVTYNLAKDWDADTLIGYCRETGFEGVEPRTTHAHGIEPSLGKSQRFEVKKKFEGAGIELCGLGTACEYHSIDPDQVSQNIEITKQWVVLARDLNAPGVKVRPNGVHVDQGVPLEKTLEQIGLSARQCAEFASNEGVEIRMEVHGRVTHEIPNMKIIVDVADHPNFKICWNSNPGETIDGSIQSSFGLLRDKISLVHINEIGEPKYPWQELFGLLKQSGYTGFCCAEIPPSDQPVRLMHYYNALFRCHLQLADSNSLHGR